MKISVIIPTANERFLPQTVRDVLAKSAGEVEAVVSLDEYSLPEPISDDHRIKIVPHPQRVGMRTCINDGVSASTGDFVMKLDGHCMMAPGWDEVMKKDCGDDQILVPRRYSLDPEAWEIRPHRPFIDYEYISFPYTQDFQSVKAGNKWWTRQEERANILLDENMAFQGSCMFMSRTLWDRIGPLQTEGYGGFILDSEEMSNKCWLSGGRVLTQKGTWYAHLHKGAQYGRGYFINKWELRRGRKYHIDYWMHDRWPKAVHRFEWLVERFWPVPGWPEDWRDPRYEHQYLRAIGAE